jgi:uncharacterized repeat protein (TIGR03803 family)
LTCIAFCPLFIGLARAAVTFEILANSIDPTDGYWAEAAMIQANDGAFYGVTKQGGNTDVKLGSDGTIFRLSVGGNLTTLFRFNGTNGAYPEAALLEGQDGALYGTTYRGGLWDSGTVFRLDQNGEFTNLVFFDNFSNGSWPQGALIQDSAGWLYGTTSSGGSNYSSGTVFKLATNGTLITLATFKDGGRSINPHAGVVLGKDGNLYGTTYQGGAYYKGSIFRCGTNGGLTTLFSFAGTNGWYCTSPLIQDTDGTFYGTAVGGGPVVFNDHSYGTRGYGTIFKMTEDGVLTTLAYFDGTNGAYPYSGLVRGRDGAFYGTTVAGGPLNDGTVFRVTREGVITTLHAFLGSDGSQLYAGLVEGLDGRFYGSTVTLNNGVHYRVGFPTAPILRSLCGLGSELLLAWSSVAGQTYQLQYRSDCGSGGWTNLGPANTATNGMAYGSDTIGQSAKRFYRVFALP